MRIFTKLITAILIALTLLFGAIYLLMQWSFDRGMLDYVNQRESQRMELLADNLSVYYEEFGSWDALKDRSPIWPRLIEVSELGQQLTAQTLKQIQELNEEYRFHEDRRLANTGRRPPPPDMQNRRMPPRDRNGRPPPRNGRDGPLLNPDPNIRLPHSRPDQPRSINYGERLAFVDADKLGIVGRLSDQHRLVPILLNAQTIGWLGIPSRIKITENIDLAFVESQNEAFLIISIVMLVIVVLVALPLSNQLIKPIKQLVQATSQLKLGNYEVGLDGHGRDELAQLARDFKDLAVTLAHTETSRKQWLADVSHELRTPLSIVKGEIEAMMDGIRPLTNENLQSLEEEISHLQRLINDLHQLSSSEVGALSYQKEQVNLVELVQQNSARHEAELNLHGLTLTTQVNVDKGDAWIDTTRVNQLFDNIINNSVKYTDEPGQLRISISRYKSTIVVEFEDTPPNVPEASLDKLFDHLYRVDTSRNRKTGGSGLGLALCKKIVQNHDGSIEAYHSSLGGLGIRVTLPLI